MKEIHPWVIGLITLLGAGLFIGGVMVTSSWSSIWGRHMSFEDNHGIIDEDECHNDSEDWHSHMHDHMGDHWDEDECHNDLVNQIPP